MTLPLASLKAASVDLAWDKNPENNIVAYELSYGTAPGIYPNTIDVGNRTNATIEGLESGSTYYFVVVARNKAGLVGPKSAEVSHTPYVRVIVPPKGSITSPENSLTIVAGERIKFEGVASDPNDKNPLTCRWDFGAGSGIPDSEARSPGFRRFNRPGTYQVTFTVTNAVGATDPTPGTRTIVVKAPVTQPVSHKRWRLKFVDSQETIGYAATNAFDGNPATFWHTRFINTSLVKKPHEIQIDMRDSVTVSGFQYTPRQDGFNVGNVAKFQFFVSMDGKNWGKPVASGVFENSNLNKQVYFAPKRGRYIRLRSLSEANGYTDTNMAELVVLKTVTKKTTAPIVATTSSAPSATPSASARTSASGASSAAPPANPGLNEAPLTSLSTEVIDGRRYLALTYFKPAVPDDVKRTVQVSPDLLDWFSGEKHTTVVTDNDTLLKVRDNTPVTPDRKRFIRLKSTPR